MSTLISVEIPHLSSCCQMTEHVNVSVGEVLWRGVVLDCGVFPQKYSEV